MQKIDETFIDDPLRILRGIRMAVKLGFLISDLTLESMVRNVDRLSIITKERIADELNKMLMCDDPVCAIRMLADIGAMRYVIPELYGCIGLKQDEYDSDDVFEHSLNVLNLVARRPFYGAARLEVRMAALLHDIGKAETSGVGLPFPFHRHETAGAETAEKILRNLRYSNDFIEEVKFLIENHMVARHWGDVCEHMKDKALRRLQHRCGYRRFFELMTLIDADNKSHFIDVCLPNQVYMINKYTNLMVDDNTDMFDYRLPVNGNDVMDATGMKPGREVKECLEYAMDIAYSNPKTTRDDMLKYIKGYWYGRNYLF